MASRRPSGAPPTPKTLIPCDRSRCRHLAVMHHFKTARGEGSAARGKCAADKCECMGYIEPGSVA